MMSPVSPLMTYAAFANDLPEIHHHHYQWHVVFLSSPASLLCHKLLAGFIACDF